MKIKTKDLVIAALLTSMSIIIPNIFPTLPLGPFTATFASHLPTIVAMFISPVVAIITAIGSVIGFAIKFSAMPWIIARAAMHIPFAILGAYMIKKNYNLIITILLTMVVHAGLEVLVLIPFLDMIPKLKVNWYSITFFGTALHHLIDFTLAVIIVSFLVKAKFIKYSFRKKEAAE